MAAINAGLCEVALITHGESGVSRIAMPAPRWGDDSTNTQFELVARQRPGPPTGYGLLATRHMHEYGTTKRADGRGRGGDAQVGGAQSEGLRARSDHDRRRARTRA